MKKAMCAGWRKCSRRKNTEDEHARGKLDRISYGWADVVGWCFHDLALVRLVK